MLEHPAYSPDLSPSDFFLFPKLKEILKGRHFEEIDDLRCNTTAALKAFHNTNSIIVLKGGLGAGIGAYLPKGGYFEGDHSGIQQ